MYGSEGWLLDDEACRCLNGANAYMHIRYHTHNRQDKAVTTATTTFDNIVWIRARRLRWVGHIMRMQQNCNGEERQIKETLKVIFHNRQPGDILMDVNETSWEELQKAAADKHRWRARVHSLKKAEHLTTKKEQKAKPADRTTHRIHKQRFTFSHNDNA